MRLAVLHDSGEAQAPSPEATIRHFARVAAKAGVEVCPIDGGRLAHIGVFDGLFIRVTTAVGNLAYDAAWRAWSRNVPVIDDPVSIVRCHHKAPMLAMLARAGIPVPETVLVTSADDLQKMLAALVPPLVLK